MEIRLRLRKIDSVDIMNIDSKIRLVTICDINGKVRVFVPFTEGHYYGRGERPNTELADNSYSAYRKKSLISS
ncbi:MAG TPA: hypothetical protein VFY41_06735 [Nitrososphaeraceae archaeon]|nr:hypothetical protein [Nitrososphaeraceae archaeon]